MISLITGVFNRMRRLDLDFRQRQYVQECPKFLQKDISENREMANCIPSVRKKYKQVRLTAQKGWVGVLSGNEVS